MIAVCWKDQETTWKKVVREIDADSTKNASLETYTTIHRELVLSVESEHLDNAISDDCAGKY